MLCSKRFVIVVTKAGRTPDAALASELMRTSIEARVHTSGMQVEGSSTAEAFSSTDTTSSGLWLAAPLPETLLLVCDVCLFGLLAGYEGLGSRFRLVDIESVFPLGHPFVAGRRSR